MVEYYFSATLNKNEVPLIGFTITAEGSTLTVDATLPSNSSYADSPAGSVLVIKDGNNQEVTRAAYAGFNAAKSSYQYSQTLQFLHPVNILLNAPFAFPLSSLSTSVYKKLPDYYLYKLTGGKDIKSDENIPASFFDTLAKHEGGSLYDFFEVASNWSASLKSLMNKYCNDNEMKSKLAKVKIDIKKAASHFYDLAINNKFDTPSFIDMNWILNTLLSYTNNTIFCQPNGDLDLDLADNVNFDANITINQSDIEQVNIWYSWIQPTAAMAFLSEGTVSAELDVPIVTVVYNGLTGECISGENIKEIEGIAQGMAFGTYSPLSIATSFPFLAPSNLKDDPKAQQDLFNKACQFAKRHYWRLYKTTNSYELLVPLFTVKSGVGKVCAFGLNNKIFFGQIVSISHRWTASGDSNTKIVLQGVKGYELNQLGQEHQKRYQSLIANQPIRPKSIKPSKPISRTMTIF